MLCWSSSRTFQQKVDSHDAEDEPKDQADRRTLKMDGIAPTRAFTTTCAIDSVRAWKQTLNCYVYGFELLNLLDGQ